MKVLVVDDEPSVGTHVSDTLNQGYDPTSKNCEVSQVNNCSDAQHLLSKEKFDVVLMDQTMIGIQGLECLKYVREEHPDILIVMIADSVDYEFIQQCYIVGADEYLTKQNIGNLLKDTITSAQMNRGKKLIIDQQTQNRSSILSSLMGKRPPVKRTSTKSLA